MPNIFPRILDLIDNLHELLLDQPSIKLRTTIHRLQDRLQIIDPTEEILRAHRLHNHQPITRAQGADSASHIAVRMTRERRFFQRAASRGLGGRVGDQRILQAQHCFGNPGSSARRELCGAEFLTVSQTVAQGVASGAAVVFGLEAIWVEGAGVGLRLSTSVGAGFTWALVRRRGTGGGGRTALDGVVARTVAASVRRA